MKIVKVPGSNPPNREIQCTGVIPDFHVNAGTARQHMSHKKIMDRSTKINNAFSLLHQYVIELRTYHCWWGLFQLVQIHWKATLERFVFWVVVVKKDRLLSFCFPN